MSLTVSNADKFSEVLEERKITTTKLRQLIDQYVAQHGSGGGAERAMQAANIRKELNRESMNDKILTKGLTIIGLSEAEVAEVLER
jgi:hypothetical protein